MVLDKVNYTPIILRNKVEINNILRTFIYNYTKSCIESVSRFLPAVWEISPVCSRWITNSKGEKICEILISKYQFDVILPVFIISLRMYFYLSGEVLLWVDHGSTISWPPLSPVFSPLGFSVWFYETGSIRVLTFECQFLQKVFSDLFNIRIFQLNKAK